MMCVVVVGIVGAVLIKRCVEHNHEDDDHTAHKQFLRIGRDDDEHDEIYVCSAMMEDYTIQRATERNLIMPDEEHSCVQTMTQKCSYVIDLDKVEYEAVDSIKTIYVKLPDVEYVATTQSTSFLSDDGNYWAEHLPNTNAMKRKVEGQIKRRFDTPSNRRKAERFAEDAISEVMRKLGYETEFIRSLEKRKE